MKVEKARELVAQWRKKARDINNRPICDGYSLSVASALNDCADELECAMGESEEQ